MTCNIYYQKKRDFLFFKLKLFGIRHFMCHDQIISYVYDIQYDFILRKYSGRKTTHFKQRFLFTPAAYLTFRHVGKSNSYAVNVKQFTNTFRCRYQQSCTAEKHCCLEINCSPDHAIHLQLDFCYPKLSDYVLTSLTRKTLLSTVTNMGLKCRYFFFCFERIFVRNRFSSQLSNFQH